MSRDVDDVRQRSHDMRERAGWPHTVTSRPLMTEQDHKEMAEAFESDRMREFCRWVIRESCFDGCDIDGGAVQEKAIALGLLEPTTATADMVASNLYGECEAGDTVYVFSGPIKS